MAGTTEASKTSSVTAPEELVVVATDNTECWEEVLVDGVLVRRLVPIPVDGALAGHNWMTNTRGWRRLGRR